MGTSRTCIVPENVKFKYYFIPPEPKWVAGVKQPQDDFTMHITVGGYNSAFNTAFEFNVCKWHGCSKCNVGDDDAKRKYEQTRLAQKRALGKQTCHNEAVFLRKVAALFRPKTFFIKMFLFPKLK